MPSSGDDGAAASAKHLRLIPDELAQEIGAREALVVGPLGGNGKVVWRVELAEACGFAAGWLLVLRRRGRGVLTVKAFDDTRCLWDLGAPAPPAASTLLHSEKLQQAQYVSIQKHRRKNRTSIGRSSIYKIGPPSWIKKQINTNTTSYFCQQLLFHYGEIEANIFIRSPLTTDNTCVLATAFCDAIGLWEPCTIMLRTSTEGNGSWVVRGLPCKGRSYLLVQGWRLFCQENRLKEGDICTFNVIETTMWDVIITRHKEKMNQFCDVQQGTPKSKKYMSSTDAKKRVQGSMTYLNKARTKGAFEIGPPAWIKEINTSIIENQQLVSTIVSILMRVKSYK
uniref:TF-B3 domain-containing protein n=1 Tax=Setaria italica TaxID=4555 RepID=K3YBQ9_SETIT